MPIDQEKSKIELDSDLNIKGIIFNQNKKKYKIGYLKKKVFSKKCVVVVLCF